MKPIFFIGKNMLPTKNPLGKFVRSMRLALNFSQARLAKLAFGFPGASQISRIERGETQRISPRRFDKLAQSLDCSVEDLTNLVSVGRYREPTTEVGKIIREKRKELGLSLHDFAKKMNITEDDALKIELRENSKLSKYMVKKLVGVLGIDEKVFDPYIPRAKEKETLYLFGKRIRERRKELRLSLEQVGEMIGVSRQRMSQIELGHKRQCCDSDLILRIAAALYLDSSELLALRQEKRLKEIKSTNPLSRMLVKRRLELHLSRKKLSKMCALNSATLMRAEREGGVKNTTLLKIIEALGLDPVKALDYESEYYKPAP